MEFDIMMFVFPLLICLARVGDVSLGTLRMVSVVRGRVLLASGLGFFEIILWVLAASKVLTELDNPLNVIGYACGFALGNAVGIIIEQKLAIGQSGMRIISRGKGREIASALRERGLRVTELDGQGKLGPVVILYVILGRADSTAVQKIAEEVDPEVFIAVDDAHSTNRLLRPTVVPATGIKAFLRK